jgi:hypothetical protein
MTTEDLHAGLQGIQGCWNRALADLQEVSGGLEAIIKTPGENDLVAIAKHYGRDPKVFAIGMFDAVIMLKALTTVLEMTEPMLKKILPLTVEERLEAQLVDSPEFGVSAIVLPPQCNRSAAGPLIAP